MTKRIPLRAAVLAASLATAVAAFAAPHVAEPAYLNNAEARCGALPAAARDACVARVRGAGGATGSVAGGGILYGTSGTADTTYHGGHMNDGTGKQYRKTKVKKAKKARKPVVRKAAMATPAPAAAPVAATKAPPQTPGAQPASKVAPTTTVGQAVSNAAKATASAAKTTAAVVKSAASKAVSK